MGLEVAFRFRDHPNICGKRMWITVPPDQKDWQASIDQSLALQSLMVGLFGKGAHQQADTTGRGATVSTPHVLKNVPCHPLPDEKGGSSPAANEEAKMYVGDFPPGGFILRILRKELR